ncbi:NAD(P)-binding domain-containing protein [Terribacillus sp. 179-K 1B1 HS]|uniref:NAD(P)-binding domain-containing protein n=1 Tax=Terribacillus sp. 179-K 1B1 HS TaxID=3142388 RepID=UPI0039A278A1
MGNDLPVVIIGSGPVGLAAAAHLAKYGVPFLILEKGEAAGSTIKEWKHVRLFSPWEYNIDQAAKELLEGNGWLMPDITQLPTGGELVASYLQPLAALPEIAPYVVYGAEVIAVTREGVDKLKTAGRDKLPFLVYAKSGGKTAAYRAKAVIDASGTWHNPNPPSADGVWQKELQVHTDIPSAAEDMDALKNKHIAVIGSGHSALQTLAELAQVKQIHPDTAITWLIRRGNPASAYGGKERDQLAARGALGMHAESLVNSGVINIKPGFRTDEITNQDKRLRITSLSGEAVEEVDEIYVNTGARPDFSFLREIRYQIDPAIESTPALAPLIDPNVHSCGTVRPHGEKELRQPEPNFYIAGVKSYGRAPTFLLATGYEQVRSIVAMIAGDKQAAEQVKLSLPETGVCSTDRLSVQTSCSEKGSCTC